MPAENRTPQFVIEPLGRDHDRTAFSCGVEALDRYLKIQAGQDARKNAAAPFVAVERGTKRVDGYYTLSMTGIDTHDFPDDVTKKFPKYPIAPAILLGRLAVDTNRRGTGLGKLLLMDALARSLRNEIAWIAMIVDAKDPSGISFYERYGFIAFPEIPLRWFIPRKKIEDAFR